MQKTRDCGYRSDCGVGYLSGRVGHDSDRKRPGGRGGWWNITAPSGVSLTVTSSGNQIDIEKLANFTGVNQGLQVSFQPIADAATVIDFTDEQIQNNTGSAFNGFQFILMNAGSASAAFPSVSDTFGPPAGTGYSYSSVKLNAAGDILSYTGTQNAGSTSTWGTGTPGTPGVGNPNDNLFIDAPAGAVFSLKELSSGSGGGGGTSAVPMPAAAWQSLAGLRPGTVWNWAQAETSHGIVAARLDAS